ncbi:hypothetical protein EVAR_69314_1 [Eumeta japonica]|uniref:Uncharacterized protein n=1 Tax=Eumeta variegata TaxID=151549 RepID=A0A4C1TJY9_EUMVA|nr:hypothetical protein EVAR_69314_1 [Eumeta japonica]
MEHGFKACGLCPLDVNARQKCQTRHALYAFGSALRQHTSAIIKGEKGFWSRAIFFRFTFHLYFTKNCLGTEPLYVYAATSADRGSWVVLRRGHGVMTPQRQPQIG